MRRYLCAAAARNLPSKRPFTTNSPLRAPYGPDEKSDFLGSFLQTQKVPLDTIEHFSSISWTRKILQDDAYETIPFFSRYFNEVTGENGFYGRTVNTSSTMPHLLSRRLRKWNATSPHEVFMPKDLSEVLCLISFGRGLDSHPGIVHGGFQCIIFDEIIRFLILLHHHETCQTCLPGPRHAHLTVKLETKYHAPLNSPSTVLVRSRLTGREGRKWWAEAVIEDCEGNALSSATTMWVTARQRTD